MLFFHAIIIIYYVPSNIKDLADALYYPIRARTIVICVQHPFMIDHDHTSQLWCDLQKGEVSMTF